jgi:hypothetical protein
VEPSEVGGTFGSMASSSPSLHRCRVAVRIDGVVHRWPSRVELSADEDALHLDSEVGPVTVARELADRVERVRRFSARGVRLVGEGSGQLIWSLHPGEVEAVLEAAGWTVTPGRARFVGGRGLIDGGPTFWTDRELISSL